MKSALFHITPMRASDTAEVAAIEALSQPTPWAEAVFAGELDRDWAHVDVARAGETMVGFCNYWLVHDEVQLLNLATHPDWRRRGVGATLLRHLFGVGRDRGARIVILEVRVGNLAAQALYSRHGFVTEGRRAGYYADTGEDALVMVRELETAVKTAVKTAE